MSLFSVLDEALSSRDAGARLGCRRVLVTGGAGFIGSHTAAAFLAAGWEVSVLDDLSTGRRENVPAGALYISGDIRDRGDVDAAIRGCGAVVHLAAFTSVPESFQRQAHCFDVNVRGTLTLLEAALAAGVRRVVIASSSAVYPDEVPEALDEDTTPRPSSPYAQSKIEGESLLARFSHNGFGWVALRYFNVYGPAQPAHSAYSAAVPAFVERVLRKQPMLIYGTGEQTRDFGSVADVAQANVLAVTSGHNGVFNIGSGRGTSVLELAEAVEAVAGVRVGRKFLPPRPGDALCSVASVDRAKRVLGWQAVVGLEEGLHRTLAWWRERGMARA